MLNLKGQFNTAKVFTDNIEEEAISQIKTLLNQEFVRDSKIRFMPDVHAGAGCVIGTTLTITNGLVVPNLIGVDIGCGMLACRIKSDSKTSETFEPQALDKVIRKYIPIGNSVRKSAHAFADNVQWNKVRAEGMNVERARKSIGSLGSGNHFIEINRNKNNDLYIVIHSGSRHFGLEVAKHYQKKAWLELSKSDMSIPEALAYCSGLTTENYLNDLGLAQDMAHWNRKTMLDEIKRGLGVEKNEIADEFETVHNYIELEAMIARKGAVSAKNGEILIIPMNMRDGSLICTGKGNEDWNCSAPHGAGRIMSRGKAKATLNMEDFKNEMKSVYSTTISTGTLDEAPMAYKPMQEIIDNIGDTVDVMDIIKPIYNFKAAS
ncbi:MAG: RtcB family protein [Fibromonadales bacterium]|nr:RtcB family protein [Fibromonadales bacterium]